MKEKGSPLIAALIVGVLFGHTIPACQLSESQYSGDYPPEKCTDGVLFVRETHYSTYSSAGQVIYASTGRTCLIQGAEESQND